MASDPFASQHRKAARELRRIYREHKAKYGVTSWALVRDYLETTKGVCINRGTLSGVARGKRDATPQIFRALGMPVPHYKPAPACPECGKVHYRSLRSCPDKKKLRKPGKPWKAALYAAARVVIGLRAETDGPVRTVDEQVEVFFYLATMEAQSASH